MNSAARSSLLFSLALFSCGHDDSGSTFSSDLPKHTDANKLDDKQRQDFCRTLDTHVDVTVGLDEVARLICLPFALLSASHEDCEALLDSCSRDATKVTLDRTSQEQKCFDSLASCEADVGTLEGCVNVNVRAVRQVLERVTCARYGDADAGRELDEAMTGQTCAKTSSSCQDAVLLY
jgi:hypothetical protein